MAWDPHWDTAIHSSHTPRVGAGEPRATAATRRVEGAPATPTAERDGPNLLDSAVEAVDELAAFIAVGTAGDGGRLAPARIPTLLGVEESTPMGSARDGQGPAGSDSADEPRQSLWGAPRISRRAVEARPDCLAGDGVEVHGPASEAAVAGVANIPEEPRPDLIALDFFTIPTATFESCSCSLC